MDMGIGPIVWVLSGAGLIAFVIVCLIAAVICFILIRKMITKRRDEKYYENKAKEEAEAAGAKEEAEAAKEKEDAASKEEQ